MKIAVVNVGSTSLKFKVFEMPEERILCDAHAERVGSIDSAGYVYRNYITGEVISRRDQCMPDFETGVRMFINDMTDPEMGILKSENEIRGVGFKSTVSRGYLGVHELTEDVIQGMRDYIPLAPSHNIPYLMSIDVFKKAFPAALFLGVFETSFHETIPAERRIYSVPYEWYEKYGIMRLGYHGASHSYIARRTLDENGKGKVISCHLGGSSSICALLDGKSVDNSFGFSVQGGIPHANRVGDADPYIATFLLEMGMSPEEIKDGFVRNGGLKGISGVSDDLRDIEKAADEGNERALLALKVYVCEIVRYIGMYYAELGGLEKLTFTGGIGENSATVRRLVCDQLRHMGIWLDHDANSAVHGDGRISTHDSPVEILVFKANEESRIARETYSAIEAKKN